MLLLESVHGGWQQLLWLSMNFLKFIVKDAVPSAGPNAGWKVWVVNKNQSIDRP